LPNQIVIMNIENTKAQMRKGILELCILAILKERERYPSEILEALKDTELIVVEGTLYPLLTRLKNDELLDYRWEESSSGPPRKYYSISEKGKEVLTELKLSWSILAESVNNLLK
jgi:PadR family transcriptional regulator, regulatory protein PadR